MQQDIKRIINIWDDHASRLGIKRLPGEDNRELKSRLLNACLNREDTTKQGIVNSVSSFFGYPTYNVRDRNIFYLTRDPYISSTFTVTVDGAVQTQITEDDYSDASTGFIVWRDVYGEYTRILEFLNVPAYTRRIDGLHDGSNIIIDYQYQVGNSVRRCVDRSNPYDPYDDSFMGWAAETEGAIKVGSLSDNDWIESIGLIDEYKVPSEQLVSIWKELDKIIPMTWGA